MLSGDILSKDKAQAYFETDSPPSEAELSALETMVKRWQSYHAQGIFSLSVDEKADLGVPQADSAVKGGLDGAAFWTTSLSFWRLNEQRALMDLLGKSGLVIFKGDLKYVGIDFRSLLSVHSLAWGFLHSYRKCAAMTGWWLLKLRSHIYTD